MFYIRKSKFIANFLATVILKAHEITDRNHISLLEFFLLCHCYSVSLTISISPNATTKNVHAHASLFLYWKQIFQRDLMELWYTHFSEFRKITSQKIACACDALLWISASHYAWMSTTNESCFILLLYFLIKIRFNFYRYRRFDCYIRYAIHTIWYEYLFFLLLCQNHVTTYSMLIY